MISVGGTPPTVWGGLTVTPHVEPVEAGVDGVRRAIKTAMALAVLQAELGELVVQCDVDVTMDYRRLPATVGAVRALNRPRSHRHCCPQAFIVYDDATRLRVVEAWLGRSMRACVAWADIPKVSDMICATHLEGVAA